MSFLEECPGLWEEAAGEDGPALCRGAGQAGAAHHPVRPELSLWVQILQATFAVHGRL